MTKDQEGKKNPLNKTKGDDSPRKSIKDWDKKFAVPVICITLPNAKDVTIKRSKLLSTLLITCLIESTWNIIIKTTPISAATTKGNISNAPRNITDRKM